MDKAEAIQRARRYADVVRQHFDVQKIVLFGSYADGRQREHSDIDIAVVVHGVPGDWLRSATTLSRLTDGIDVRIEPVMLDETSDPSGFLEHVLRTGEIIYSRDS